MTSPATLITDHPHRAIARMLGQFSRSPKIRALAEIVGDEIQVLENHLYALLMGRTIDAAEGEVLNQIGARVGVSRLGRSDTEYRRMVRVGLAVFLSHSGVDEIIGIASALFGATVQYIQEGDARFRLCYDSSEAMEPEFLAEAMQMLGRAIGGGVAWTLVSGDDEDDGSRFGSAAFDDGTFGAVVGAVGVDA